MRRGAQGSCKAQAAAAPAAAVGNPQSGANPGALRRAPMPVRPRARAERLGAACAVPARGALRHAPLPAASPGVGSRAAHSQCRRLCGRGDRRPPETKQECAASSSAARSSSPLAAFMAARSWDAAMKARRAPGGAGDVHLEGSPAPSPHAGRGFRTLLIQTLGRLGGLSIVPRPAWGRSGSLGGQLRSRPVGTGPGQARGACVRRQLVALRHATGRQAQARKLPPKPSCAVLTIKAVPGMGCRG